MSSSQEDLCLFPALPDPFASLSLSFLICAMGTKEILGGIDVVMCA